MRGYPSLGLGCVCSPPCWPLLSAAVAVWPCLELVILWQLRCAIENKGGEDVQLAAGMMVLGFGRVTWKIRKTEEEAIGSREMPVIFKSSDDLVMFNNVTTTVGAVVRERQKTEPAPVVWG